ncbi:MarR family winged helix-turn-helix transcriptional regulator [Roseivirga sp. E12]|uniref:MarR family winged helix-turn-helix transcriptional regulator n=1 Tax=Roseivirga sp. E12 TaxID=2819237 RepID=UPI001ABBF2FB|nr:MarR family transcriptional regulator [Roseivirga sp. E12]MBO3698189.1 MarR family transcriptional regulator [Roseivirga sp. E12]
MENKTYFSAIVEIIKTGHWITDMVSQELKEYDISEPQFNVLRILKGQKGKPITVEVIASLMIHRSSNVTRIIDKLLIRGLVSRQECQTNRRKMDINITAEGIEFLKLLDKKVTDFHKPMMSKISEKEAKDLTRIIKKLKE